jgi:hypothetical protein
MRLKWRRPEGLRPVGPFASSSLLNGSIKTRFVTLPSARLLWTQRRRYRKSQTALVSAEQFFGFDDLFGQFRRADAALLALLLQTLVGLGFGEAGALH